MNDYEARIGVLLEKPAGLLSMQELAEVMVHKFNWSNYTITDEMVERVEDTIAHHRRIGLMGKGNICRCCQCRVNHGEVTA